MRVWSWNLQTLGDRLDAPTDRASRLSCATIVIAVSSRNATPLRRRGHAASPENVSVLQPALRDRLDELNKSRVGSGLPVEVSNRPCALEDFRVHAGLPLR